MVKGERCKAKAVNPKPKTLNQKSTDGLNNYLTGIVPGENRFMKKKNQELRPKSLFSMFFYLLFYFQISMNYEFFKKRKK